MFAGGGLVRRLEVRRIATARRALLRVDPCDGTVRLTLPPRMPARRVEAWVEQQRGWIEAQLARLPGPSPIRAGGTMPWRGESLRIDWSRTAPRRPVLGIEGLLVGGPPDGLARRVLSWARAEALAVLDAETRTMAARGGVAVAHVAVGDPRGRWGSCNAAGDIRYSWRLALAPPFVLAATVAHEVAHRLHMHHGPAFHDAVAVILGGDPAPANAWLRRHGAALHWIGMEEAMVPRDGIEPPTP